MTSARFRLGLLVVALLIGIEGARIYRGDRALLELQSR